MLKIEELADKREKKPVNTNLANSQLFMMRKYSTETNKRSEKCLKQQDQ